MVTGDTGNDDDDDDDAVNHFGATAVWTDPRCSRPSSLMVLAGAGELV